MMNRPSAALIKVWLFCGVFLPITMSLGFWQLDRADEKTRYLDQISQRENKPLTVWQSNLKANQVFFQPFELVGHYQSQHFLLDNRVRNGKPGYEVLTPFRLFTGELVLVNRGWLAAGKYRHELPEINSPEALVTVQGRFYQSQGDIPVLKDVAEETEWPRRIQHIKWPLIEQAIDTRLTEQVEFRLIDAEQAGAFKVGWPKTSILPEKHLGYAYQWFGLSLALVVLTFVATAKIKRSEAETNKKIQ